MNWQLTHPLLGLLYSVIVSYTLKFLNTQFEWSVPLWFICLFGFTIACTYYYAREAGQLEHDYKNAGSTPLAAWAKAQFGIWPLTNWAQAGAAFAGGLVGSLIAYNFNIPYP